MEISAGVVLLTLGLVLALVLLAWYASTVGTKAHLPENPVPTGNPAMERKVVVILGMMLVSVLLLTAYAFVEPGRQERALVRQEHLGIERASETFASNCAICHGVDGRGAVVPGTDPPRVAPALNTAAFMDKDPEKAKEAYTKVTKTVSRGRAGTPMAAWSKDENGPLLNEQIHELALMITHGDEKVKFGGKEVAVWDMVRERSREHIAKGSPAPIPPSIAVQGCEGECAEGKELWEKKGACVGCHIVGGVGGATGPDQSKMATVAAGRKPGTSAQDYIKESIRQPAAFVVQGYPPIMPAYGPGQLSDAEVDKIVAFLMTLK
ncbi:MAG: cytochrome c [Chloroflexota bacterium]